MRDSIEYFRSGRRSGWIVAAGSTGVVVGAIAVALVVSGLGGDDRLRNDLEAEFEGAYPAEPVGGGNLVEVDLIAAPSSIALVEAGPTDVWSYNSTVPGPALRIQLGDTLRAVVRNDLPAATTIHWHGIRVPNDMDGVPGVNQRQIEPGDSFTYEFTPPDAGTYWYHSHTDGSEQLERGLYGSLVVEDPTTTDRYEHDAVWVIDDWLLEEDGKLAPEFDTAADRTHNGRWGNLITVNSSTTETLEVRAGEQVRLRLVNASNGRVYAPDFGDLDVTVTAIDGLTVKQPFAGESLDLAPGNRADFDITAPGIAGTYIVVDNYTGTPRELASIVVTDGQAGGAEIAPVVNSAVPEWDAAVGAPVDHELVFETEQKDGEWLWTINGVVFGDHDPLVLAQGEFTKISLVNQTHPMHPIHLHGQFFKVLSRNGAPVDEPYFRDTVLLEMLDEVEIGLVPLDVGDWVLHCHIQEHAEAGMMTVVEVAPGDS